MIDSSFPGDWADLFQQTDQPLDMDAFLKSDLLATRRSVHMVETIGFVVTGSISFIASMLLVIHILRSHDCLSTTYHRLVFGLSVADIINSIDVALSSTMAPKEMSYLVPFASGNTATCDAQGFLISFLGGVSALYNCSICFYYLAIITYNKKEEYIRRKLEPWFHGISILVPLMICIILLATHAFNGANGGTCFIDPYIPPHCIGYDVGEIPSGYSIPCGRGGEEDKHAVLRTISVSTAYFLVLIVVPFVIVGTMITMYMSVSKIEQQMRKYGVGALRLRTTLAAAPTTINSVNANARGFMSKVKRWLKHHSWFGNTVEQTNHEAAAMYLPRWCPRLCCCAAGADDQAKSNTMRSQKRAVLHMAFGYSGAWLLVWIPFIISHFIIKVQRLSGSVGFLATALQGFYNFVVFMAPKVRTTRMAAMRRRHNRKHLTWCQAFYEAYMSRSRLQSESMRVLDRN
jgi:hypothetical protein